MDLLSFTKVLREECLIHPGDKVVVGVSGGPDSLVLAYWLGLAGCQVVVAHFNHHLRPSSDNDALFVANFARQAGLEFRLGEADVRGVSETQKVSIEMAARNERYCFLFEVARDIGAEAVAVGHQADDQAETVLMHLIRGSGLSGLRGMAYRSITQWSNAIPLIRPLLSFTRIEIESECQMQGWQPVRDETNDSVDYLRNRIRLELIPALQSYNPQIQRQLGRTAQILSGDYEVLQKAAELAWQVCDLSVRNDEILLALSSFRENPEAIQRMLLRIAVEKLRPGLTDLTYDAIQRGLDFIAMPPPAGKIEWALNLKMWINRDVLVISERQLQSSIDYPQCDLTESTPVPIPGALIISPHWRLESEVLIDPQGPPPEGHAVWLDEDKVVGRLWIRRAKPGDRFRPIGMAGRHMKIGNFFTNQKIPIHARAAWPVVGFGDEILWLVALRPAELASVTPFSHRVICLRLVRN